MTLTVTLDLSPEVEAELRKSIAARDTDCVRQMLTDVLASTVEALLKADLEPSCDNAEWDALADELIDTVATARPTELPVLSDYATSRIGIYEEHP